MKNLTSGPSSATFQLCNIGEVIQLPWALISLLVTLGCHLSCQAFTLPAWEGFNKNEGR